MANKGVTATAPEGSHPLLDLWQRLSDIQGRRVLFGYDVQRQPLFQALVQGMDKEGGLLLKLDDGSMIAENSGEIIYLD